MSPDSAFAVMVYVMRTLISGNYWVAQNSFKLVAPLLMTQALPQYRSWNNFNGHSARVSLPVVQVGYWVVKCALSIIYTSIWYTLPSHLAAIARVGCDLKNKKKRKIIRKQKRKKKQINKNTRYRKERQKKVWPNAFSSLHSRPI